MVTVGNDIKQALSLRRALTLPVQEYVSIKGLDGKSFDTQLTKVLLDFELGQLQQAKKRYFS